eukprot:3084957-Pyramimonas_sp.AAC.1
MRVRGMWQADEVEEGEEGKKKVRMRHYRKKGAYHDCPAHAGPMPVLTDLNLHGVPPEEVFITEENEEKVYNRQDKYWNAVVTQQAVRPPYIRTRTHHITSFYGSSCCANN